jgi:hypothetical protein
MLDLPWGYSPRLYTKRLPIGAHFTELSTRCIAATNKDFP